MAEARSGWLQGVSGHPDNTGSLGHFPQDSCIVVISSFLFVLQINVPREKLIEEIRKRLQS